MDNTNIESTDVVHKLGLISGTLFEVHRGLRIFGDEEIETLNKSIQQLYTQIYNIGDAIATRDRVRFRRSPDIEMGTAADLLTGYSESSMNTQNPLARRSSNKSAQSIKARSAQKLLTGLRNGLVGIQQALMRSPFRGEWERIKPYVSETNTLLAGAMQIIPTEGKERRRSVSLEAKLRGRLETINITNTHNGALASTTLKQQYGHRLGTLAENGNKFALRLVNLISKRRAILESSNIDAAALSDLEKPIAKLSKALGVSFNEESADILNMMNLATSVRNFNSKKQFINNLTEGLLLNITTLASDALSIPSGEYLVWTTDSNATMLVPTSEAINDSREISHSRPQKYDITTPDLIGCWNKVERVIGESSKHIDSTGSYKNPAGGDERVGRPSLKRKVEAAGGVRAAAERTGLSPGDVSKHVNNKEFEVSGKSAKAYMRGIGADPDDLYQYGQIKVWDYEGIDDEDDNDDDDENI